MGVKTLPAISAALISGGMPAEMPAAAVQWGTRSKQRTITATLGTIAERAADAGIAAPAVVIIGWPVILRDEITWFETRPLFGRRIVVTRAAQQSSTLSERLRELGADVIEMPAMRIARLDLSPLRDEMKRFDEYQWIIFTSQNAVKIFWEQLLGGGRDARALAGLKIAAVGPATAGALLEHGITVDIIPDRFVAEGFSRNSRSEMTFPGAVFLYVTAEGSREVLPDGLEGLGAEVSVSHAYRSIRDGSDSSKLKRALEVARESRDIRVGVIGARLRDAVGEELALKGLQHPSVRSDEAITAAGIELIGEAEESDRWLDRCRRACAEVIERVIRIATRSSELALRQARLVEAALETRGFGL